MPSRLSKPMFDVRSSKQFEQTIRNSAVNENNVKMERHLAGYTQRQTELLESARKSKEEEDARALTYRQMYHEHRRDRLGIRREQNRITALGDEAAFHKAIGLRQSKVLRDKNFQLKTKLKKLERTQAVLKAQQQQDLDDIDAFEARLANTTSRLADTTSSTSSRPEVSTPPASTSASEESTSAFKQRLETLAGTPKQWRSEAKNYVRDLSAKKHREKGRRDERARRRRQYLAVQLGLQEDGVDDNNSNRVVKMLTRSAEVQDKLDHELALIRARKAILMKNRDFRIELYAQRRKQDVDLQMAAEENELEGCIDGFKIECEKAALQYSHRIETEDSKVHRDSIAFCHKLVHSMVSMAIDVAFYRELRFGNFSPKEPIIDADDIGVPPHVYGTFVTTLVDIPRESIKDVMLNNDEFTQYMRKAGRWEFEGDIDTETKLATLVQQVSEMTNPLPPPPKAPDLPQFSLCICILGKQSAGKTTHANQLATRYNLVVLNTEQLVQEALDDIDEYQMSWHVSQRLLRTLRDGKEVNDEMYVQLIVRAIKEIPDTKQGWILEGWPNTMEQAKLLEKSLSGHLDEAELASRVPRACRPSIIAPPPNPPVPDPPRCLFDIVFALAGENDLLFERALGRRTDPETGDIYHLAQLPNTPARLPEIGQRIVPRLERLSAEALTVKNVADMCALYDKRQLALEWWFSQFNVLQYVDTDDSLDMVQSSLRESIDTVLINKANQVEAEKQAAEERAQKEAEERVLATWVDMAGQYRKEPEDKHDPEVFWTVNPDGSSNHEVDGELTLTRLDKADVTLPDAKHLKLNFLPQLTPRVGAFTTEEGSVYTRVESEEDKAPKVKSYALSNQMARVFSTQWSLHEANYLSTLKDCFYRIRREHSEALTDLDRTRTSFVEFLRRPDDKQSIVDNYVRRFNDIPEDLRFDDRAKAHMHQLVSEMTKELWENTEGRETEARDEFNAITQNGWLEAMLEILQCRIITIAQAEVDRYIGTQQILWDHHCATTKGKLLPQEIKGDDSSPPATVPVLAEVTTKKKKKGKNDDTVGDASPLTLKICINRALSAMKSATNNIFVQLEESEPVRALIKAEQQHCLLRLKRLRVVGTALWEGLTAHSKSVYASLEEYSNDRLSMEFAVLQSLASYMRQKVEVRGQIEFMLRLSGVEFVVDKRVRILPPPPPAPKRDVQPNNPVLVTPHQLKALVAQIQSVNPDNPIAVHVLIETLLRVCSSGLMPEKWSLLTRKRVTDIVTAFDPEKQGRVLWKQVVLWIWRMGMRGVAVPTTKQLLSVKAQYKKIDSEETGRLTREQFANTPLWFEPSHSDFANRDIFFDLFATEDGTEMEWLPFLLWCCHDLNRDAGLEKAVCVVSVHGGKMLSKDEADKLLSE